VFPTPGVRISPPCEYANLPITNDWHRGKDFCTHAPHVSNEKLNSHVSVPPPILILAIWGGVIREGSRISTVNDHKPPRECRFAAPYATALWVATV
jgi:hypothetical protein